MQYLDALPFQTAFKENVSKWRILIEINKHRKPIGLLNTIHSQKEKFQGTVMCGPRVFAANC